MVFTYDGILQASTRFRFTRNVLLSGTLLVFFPILTVGYGTYESLLGIWIAKAGLDLWRCCWSLYLVHAQLWQQWGGKKLWKHGDDEEVPIASKGVVVSEVVAKTVQEKAASDAVSH